MNERMYLLPEGLRDALMNYLVSRPFKDVAGAIGHLQNLQEAPQPKEHNVPPPPQPNEH